jgi:hypothetical protein
VVLELRRARTIKVNGEAVPSSCDPIACTAVAVPSLDGELGSANKSVGADKILAAATALQFNCTNTVKVRVGGSVVLGEGIGA